MTVGVWQKLEPSTCHIQIRRATAQTVSERPLTTNGHLQSSASRCATGGSSGAVAGLRVTNTSLFPCQHRSSNTLLSFLLLQRRCIILSVNSIVKWRAYTPDNNHSSSDDPVTIFVSPKMNRWHVPLLQWSILILRVFWTQRSFVGAFEIPNGITQMASSCGTHC